MHCQLSQHTNTHWLAKLQSLVSCPKAGGNWLMNLVFFHNSLLSCLPGMHKFPYTTEAKQKTCLLSLVSSRQHPQVPHRTLHLWKWDQLRAFVSLFWCKGFFSLKYNIPSHLERHLIWPRREAVPERWGSTNGKDKEKNCLYVSQKQIFGDGHLCFPIS